MITVSVEDLPSDQVIRWARQNRHTDDAAEALRRVSQACTRQIDPWPASVSVDVSDLDLSAWRHGVARPASWAAIRMLHRIVVAAYAEPIRRVDVDLAGLDRRVIRSWSTHQPWLGDAGVALRRLALALLRSENLLAPSVAIRVDDLDLSPWRDAPLGTDPHENAAMARIVAAMEAP